MPVFADATSAMIGDDSVPSLLIITVFGSPSEAVLRAYFAWSNKVVAAWRIKGMRYVALLDATDGQRPAARVRSVVSELVDEIRTRNPDVEVATVLVTESALVRGALTAIGWLSRSSWRPQPVRTCADGLRLAKQILIDVGIEPPTLDPDSYRRPERPRS